MIISSNTPQKFIKIMRKTLGVQNKAKIRDYLGCLMEVDGRSSTTFNPIGNKSLDGILSRKFINISQMGKLLLINSILICLASHIMSIYLLPKKIYNITNFHFPKILVVFLYPKTLIYWRKKETLFSHKLTEGIGLRNIPNLNKSLFFNHAWRIFNKPSSLIHKIYTPKYGGVPLSLAMDNKHPRISSYAFKSLLKVSVAMKGGINRKLSNGRKIGLRRDIWISDHPTIPKSNNTNNFGFLTLPHTLLMKEEIGNQI